MVELTILYDYYGELLTDKQRLYFEDYYFNDLSLQEIADYEEKLKLYEKGKEIDKLIENIDENLKNKIKELI